MKGLEVRGGKVVPKNELEVHFIYTSFTLKYIII